MPQHVWSWTNDAHLSFKNVYKLGKFIEACASHKFADACKTVIVALRLFYVRLIVHAHAAELQTVEAFIIPAGSLLRKKYRTF